MFLKNAFIRSMKNIKSTFTRSSTNPTELSKL